VFENKYTTTELNMLQRKTLFAHVFVAELAWIRDVISHMKKSLTIWRFDPPK